MAKYTETPCYKPQGILTRLRYRMERLTAPQRAEEGRKRLMPGQYPVGAWNPPALPGAKKER